MGAAGRSHVESGYDRDDLAARMLSVLEDAATRRPTAPRSEA
jgi:hypothetical protein